MSCSIDVDAHIHLSTHLYEYMYAHTILMSTFEILGRLDFEINEVGQ
jgi:hypothetical protein